MTELTEERKARIWAEIIAIGKALNEETESRSEDEMTVFDYADETGLTVNQARDLLNKLCAEGKCTRRKRWSKEQSAICCFYLPISDKA